ncbi:hypothetical protein S2M10_42350 [Sphingomonas sp. S2M10]|uniref:hypothetical protein n=1 Tax=Sphingomonas sp. S2M10 TaxID=2705010 RepID=UPI00145687F7|nr:hypothetical protein [Sphingomonas sp. S2M10]NLS29214.1 hypothetical protein [Sphingomonas sp. S2M10]
MAGFAALIQALAALVAALAWPVAFVVTAFAFRLEVRQVLAKFPTFIDRIKAIKIAGIETQLDKVVEKLNANPVEGGVVSSVEIEAAAKIVAETKSLEDSDISVQMDKLCIEYGVTRKVMKAGFERTQIMNGILGRMRSLAPSLSQKLEFYKGSSDPGYRLAAVAMMQMEPEKGDLQWLIDRFRVEHAFIFYHAALVMKSMFASALPDKKRAILSAAADSLAILKKFDGIPDKNSIVVLESILNSVE